MSPSSDASPPSSWQRLSPYLQALGVLVLLLYITDALAWMARFFVEELILIAVVMVMASWLSFPMERLTDLLYNQLPQGWQHWSKTRSLCRLLAALLLVGTGLLLVGLVVNQVIPALWHQAQELWATLPGYVGRFETKLQSWITQAYVTDDGQAALAQALSQWVSAVTLWLTRSWKQEMLNLVTPAGDTLVDNLLQVGGSTLKGVIYTLTGVVVLFYSLLQGHRFLPYLVGRLPNAWQAPASRFAQEYQRFLLEFSIGQLLVSVYSGFWMAGVYALLNLPYWPLLGVLFGVLSLFPVVGVWLGAIPALLLVVFQGNGWATVGLLASLLALLAARVGWLVPALFPSRRYFHPVVAVLLLLALVQVAGLWSVFLYFPLAALLATYNELCGPTHAKPQAELTGLE